MKNVLILAVCGLALLCLSGCAGEKEFRAAMDSWVGHNEHDLIAQLGPPNRSYESSGSRYISYDQSGMMTLPGTAPTYQTTVIGNTAYTNTYGGSPATTVNLNCSRTFEVKNERIVSWSARGNNCY